MFTISSQDPAAERENQNDESQTQPSLEGSERPAKWAEPLELVGVPNLYRVSAELYRSAQPTAEGMKNLQHLGINAVVNLRWLHSDRDEIGATGLSYVRIPMRVWDPEERQMIRFLEIVSNRQHTPVLVHCEHGADRTGTG